MSDATTKAREALRPLVASDVDAILARPTDAGLLIVDPGEHSKQTWCLTHDCQWALGFTACMWFDGLDQCARLEVVLIPVEGSGQ